MARIRTIKPEFFRHEALQDLEVANPGRFVMLIFAGLWGHCDSKGRFEWRPRQLKLDILPFLTFDMSESLEVLVAAGLLKRYVVDGKEYGEIPTFEKHQRLSGKEAQDGEKHPARTEESEVKHQGSVGEAPGKDKNPRKGKGREKEVEGEKEGKGNGLLPPPAAQPSPDTKDEASDTELQAACRETWRAYAEAFLSRYGTEPVRNAKVNAAIKGFVKRVGYTDAPHVAGFYLSHADAFYLRKCHDAGLLQSDAEKLRTEWATNRKVTSLSAKQQERTGTMMDTVQSILAERADT